jgi:sigma-B regulation protein RsbU (phosphoserine phosphatase)
MGNRSLSFKLTVFILFSVGLIFLSAFAYNYYFSREAVLGYVEENARNLTQATANRIEIVLNGVQKVPRQLAIWLEKTPCREEDLLKMIQVLLVSNPEIFGSTIAFEPYGFDSGRQYYAPYNYREADQTIKTVFLGDADYHYFYWDWYQIPKELNQAVWSEPYFDEGGGNILMTTYSVPFNKKSGGQGGFAGVVTADLSLAWLQEMVSAVKIYKTGYAFLISQNGRFVTHPRNDLILRESIFSLAEEQGDRNLREIARSMIRGDQGFAPSRDFVSGKKTWLAYAPLPSSGWSLGVVIPEEELLTGIRQLGREVLLIGLFGGILLILAISLVAGTITKPLRFLALKTREIAQGNLDSDLPEPKSRDEIGRLTRSFGEMRDSLKEHISHLAEVTAAKERIESELKIARTIQQSFLPKQFPPAEGKNPFEVYALLEPAKEVGGDFYDFFWVDPEHLYLAVGDVSGKGVPSALYMAVTKTLLKGLTRPGRDPAEILNRVNQELCRDNDASMFVTVFLGIVAIRTGIFTYSNAGHLPPILMRAGGEPEWLPLPKGFLLGGLEHSTYQSKTMLLRPGDQLLLYTDGVTEAVNREAKLYSGRRLLESVQGPIQESTDQRLHRLLASVRSFEGDTPQADDITLLGITYRKPPSPPLGEKIKADQKKIRRENP